MKQSLRRKINNFLFNPEERFRYCSRLGLYDGLSDEEYIKREWHVKMNTKLGLENVKTFNEKLQWLKLNDRRKIYTTMVDKYEVKKYIASIIGKKYIVPTIGVYDKFDDIDFAKLPNKFVIKCTHDSGGIIICRDKELFNTDIAKKRINKFLRRDYYKAHREWPYKNVKPRIIIEKYMEDKNNAEMRDYKFFCFNGKPELLYISEGLENHETARMSFYDMDMKLSECRRSDYAPLDYQPKPPKNFKKMKDFSALLSKGIPHVRVDWYEINGKLYFGELTFTTCAGIVPFEDPAWDIKLGKLIDLGLAKNEV